MNNTQDKLRDLTAKLASQLNFEWDSSLTVYDDHIHITQQKKADFPKGFIHDRPINALEMVRDRQFDAIISFSQGMGLRSVHWVNNKQDLNIIAPENWINIAQALTLLTDQGKAIFLAEPSLWSSQRGQKLVEELKSKNYFVNALFELPPNSLELTSLRPYLYYLSRHKTKNLFVVELTEDSDIKQIIKNYKNNTASTNLLEGIFVKPDAFRNFQSYRVISEFNTLTRHYKSFRKIAIKDFVVEAKTSDFIEDENSVYIRLAGNFKAVKLKDITKNKYVQLILNPNKINPVYLHNFLNTDIGQKFLGSFSSGSYIQHLSVNDLLNAELYLLPLDLQHKTVEILRNAEDTIQKLQDFQNTAIYEPSKATKVNQDLQNLIDALEPLSEEECLLKRIRNGENRGTEFKSVLRKGAGEREANSNLEHAVLKTICGFLNTDGGALFVGVEDDGNILGINYAEFNNSDKFLLHFKNLIKGQIGANYYPYISYRIVNLLKQEVLVVDVEKSDRPVYMGKEQTFYVRTNPATDELRGRELVEYIENHFKELKN